MKKKLSAFLILSLIYSTSFSVLENHDIVKNTPRLYEQLQLATIGMSEDVFNKAIAGRNHLFQKQNVTNVLSIVDFSQSSNSKRLYVIDLLAQKVIFNTYVAHGRNSGGEFAYSFSNTTNSYQSSLGFYVTDSIYIGAHGTSIRLKGVEKNINDEAIKRGIVLHGASYVCESFIKQNLRLGRSQGCPAVPLDMCLPIVNCIKGGSCFFIFYPDKEYLKKTEFF